MKLDPQTVKAIAFVRQAIADSDFNSLRTITQAARVAWKYPQEFDLLKLAVGEALGEATAAWCSRVEAEAVILRESATEIALDLRRRERGPKVVLPSVGPNDDTITVPYAARAIFTELAGRSLYSRGGRLHELRDDGRSAVLVPVTVPEFIAFVPLYCDLFAWRIADKSPVLKPVSRMSDADAKAITASVEARTIPRPVASVLRCPGLAEREGSLVSMVPGYNPECGGVLVIGAAAIPAVEYVEAWETLLDLVHDFDFQTPNDRARALGAFIAPALRLAGQIPGHMPILIIEADGSQTGKGYFDTMKAAIYGEMVATVTQKSGGVGSLDESISQKLIDGNPFICLDNTRSKIDSTMLEALLTPNGSFSARVPHRGEVAIDPTRFIFSLTSNGAELTRDLANRSCIVRIRKRPSGYKWKAYSSTSGGVTDVLGYIRENQPRLLGAVHAIARHWFVRGRRSTGETRHSFRGWAGIMDWIVQRGTTDRLLDGHEQVQERVGDPSLVWLRAVSVHALDEITPAWATRLVEISNEHGITVPNCRADADDHAKAKVVGGLMRKIMAGEGRHIIDGIEVVLGSSKDGHGDPHNSYTFTRVPGTPGRVSTLLENGGDFMGSCTPSRGSRNAELAEAPL